MEVRGLTRRFGGLVAVRDVSLVVPAGVIKGIIGPNGAGKTTLFNLMSGALAPHSGEVLFEGRRITGAAPQRVACAGVARTFQTVRLFAGMSVLENVMIGRHRHGTSGLWAGLLGLPGARREARDARIAALGCLERLGVAGLARAEAVTLALGQQREVELARALALEPKLLLLDEPAAGLNMHETAALAELILKIREGGVTILLVEHDMSLVMGVCDDVAVLSFGEKIAEGSPHAIQRNPEVVRVYLGEDGARP
ncbi:MAG: ABC transporter ATP-binding protein [Vicinamibacteria bacterium]|nr:ABC transporter ATP-binding protein [Vicinamibacteria bacterium]